MLVFDLPKKCKEHPQMPNDKEQDKMDPSKAFLQRLDETGFFKQINDLETNLKKIADELKDLGGVATQRLDETESLAAHILAVESILEVILKKYPVGEGEVEEAVRARTAPLSGNAEGSATVKTIAENLVNGTPEGLGTPEE
jgi:hypothetical protein